MMAIKLRGEVEPKRAWDTMQESPLKIIPQTTISQAKNTASSIAFALASNGPRGNGRCVLIVAIIEPS